MNLFLVLMKIDKQRERQTDERMDGQTDGRMDGRTDKWTECKQDERTNGQNVYRQIDTDINI